MPEPGVGARQRRYDAGDCTPSWKLGWAGGLGDARGGERSSRGERSELLDGGGVLSGVPTGVPKLPASPRPISGVCVAKRSWGAESPGRAGSRRTKRVEQAAARHARERCQPAMSAHVRLGGTSGRSPVRWDRPCGRLGSGGLATSAKSFYSKLMCAPPIVIQRTAPKTTRFFAMLWSLIRFPRVL